MSHNPTVAFASHWTIPSIGPAQVTARQPGEADGSLAPCQRNVEGLAVLSCSRAWEVSLCWGIRTQCSLKTNNRFSTSSPASKNSLFFKHSKLCNAFMKIYIYLNALWRGLSSLIQWWHYHWWPSWILKTPLTNTSLSTSSHVQFTRRQKPRENRGEKVRLEPPAVQL